MTKERLDEIEGFIRAFEKDHNVAAPLGYELLSAARESIKLREALEAQPEDSRGCTCKSMTAYDCPFHLRRGALEAK